MPKQSEKKSVIAGKQNSAATNVNNGAGSSLTSISEEVEYLETPAKSKADKNEYRAIKLPNGLKALLVTHEMLSANEGNSKPTNSSDRTSRGRRIKHPFLKENIASGKAVCSLAINVGSFSDPPDVPCISRISRNVVLTASKKYPQANSFKKLVTKCGDMVKFDDETEKTKFGFYVEESSFLDALDRFSSCFIEPLLSKDAIDNERRRIETEDLSTVQFPNFLNGKDYLLSKIVSGYDQHPARNFGPNHVKNLRDQSDERVYEEVDKFMKRHYSANRMVVVIEGHVPLDTLEKYAMTYFSEIPNNELPAPDFTHFRYDWCFDLKEFRMIYQMKRSVSVILQGDYHLELNWPMPSVQEFYRSKPHEYIAWLLNRKGKGSLFSHLEKKNWCDGLDCGVNRSSLENNSVYSLFSILISLTKEGNENRKQVLDVVFSYIKFLRREGPNQRLFEEIRKNADTTYSLGLVQLFGISCAPVVEEMHVYTPRDYVTGFMLYLEYNPAAIKQCLNLMRPEKANIIMYDKNFAKRNSVGAEWEEEDNDPVHYRRTTIAKDWLDYWNIVEPLPEFRLPEVNVTVIDDFEIIPPPENPSEYPEKIYADAVSEIYYKRDSKFKAPKTYIHHCYCSPLHLISPEKAVMLEIFGRILEHLSTDVLYSAADAAVNCVIGGTEKGIQVQVSAPVIKTGTLYMEKIADITSNVWRQITQKLFESMVQKEMKEYEDSAFEPPALAEEVRLGIVRTVRWTSLDKYMACSKLNYPEFKDFAKRFTDRVFVKCLVQGNMSKSDVVANVRECVYRLKCHPPTPDGTNFPMPTRIHKIPQGEHCYRFTSSRRNPFHKEVCSVTNYYQFPAKSLRQSALIELFICFLRLPGFKTFLAREKLDSSPVILGMDIYGKHGYSLYVNVVPILGSVDAANVEIMIEKYRATLHKVFKQMSDNDWIKARKIVTERKKILDSDLDTEVTMNWMEIGAQGYVFHREAAELAALEALPIKELRKEMMNLASSGPHIRKLTIQSVGPREAAQNSVSSNTREGMKQLCGTAKERAHKPSDYFITDIEKFKSGLETIPLTGEIAPRGDRN